MGRMEKIMQPNTKNRNNLLIGIISDTHGHIHQQVSAVFKKTDFIVHAGDMDTLEAFQELNAIAPVFAVRGNMDMGKWAGEFPKSDVIEAGNTLIYAIHNIQKIDLDPAAAGMGAVIYGHSHIPSIERQNNVVFMNPGSATLPKYSFHASVGLIRINGGALDARIVELE